MKVDKAKALRMDFGGETFYFCSEHCLHAFEADPPEHLEGRNNSPRSGYGPRPVLTEPRVHAYPASEGSEVD